MAHFKFSLHCVKIKEDHMHKKSKLLICILSSTHLPVMMSTLLGDRRVQWWSPGQLVVRAQGRDSRLARVGWKEAHSGYLGTAARVMCTVGVGKEINTLSCWNKQFIPAL